MMKHTFNISIAALSVAALSLLATGCQKQDKLGLNDGDAPLSFSVGVAGEADFEQTGSDGRATKADNRKTAITEFKIRGYEGTERWFPNTDADQTVSTSSMAYNDYIWRSGTQHTFYAYANLPASGATASIASDGVTLNYTAVPTAQASQQDILLGSYKGKGTNGKASIQFYHPLAAVAFKVGEISGVTKISSITLDGVYKSGSVKLSETSGTPAFAWTVSTTQDGVKQTSLNVTTFTTNTAIGDPFILIPQTFSSKNLTVKILATIGGVDKTISATLNTGSIEAGTTTTYAINYGDKGLNFSTPIVTAWGDNDGITAKLDKEELEPEYWVDLGMISAGGYPLYISKYCVVTGNDDELHWYTEEDCAVDPNDGSSEYYSSIQCISPDGLECRYLTESDFFSMLYDGNTTVTFSHDNFVIINKNDPTQWIVYFENKAGYITDFFAIETALFSYPARRGLISNMSEVLGGEIAPTLGMSYYPQTFPKKNLRIVYEDKDDSKRVNVESIKLHRGSYTFPTGFSTADILNDLVENLSTTNITNELQFKNGYKVIGAYWPEETTTSFSSSSAASYGDNSVGQIYNALFLSSFYMPTFPTPTSYLSGPEPTPTSYRSGPKPEPTPTSYNGCVYTITSWNGVSASYTIYTSSSIH